MPVRATRRLEDRPVIVTGAGGRLGSALVEALRRIGAIVIAVGRADFDLGGRDAVLDAVMRVRPETIFHTAAMTAVDGCEEDPDAAYRVNALGTRNVCEAAERAGARVVYLSTDHVFAGDRAEPYDEFDETGPRSVYGRSKLAGERFVLRLGPSHMVVRTSRLFGGRGSNFVRLTIERARATAPGDPLEAVTDQLAIPTYVPDLAEKIIELVQIAGGGVYHVTSAGPAVSWFELAGRSLEAAGLEKRVRLVPVTTADRPRPAARPRNGVLLGRVAAIEGVAPARSWTEALASYVGELARAGAAT